MTALATLDGIARSIKEVVGVQIARQSSLGDPTTSLNGRMKRSLYPSMRTIMSRHLSGWDWAASTWAELTTGNGGRCLPND